MSKAAKYNNTSDFDIVTGTCPHDCPDTCSWQVAVDRASGQAVDIWGHGTHPVTQGKLCGKVDRYLDRTYHRDRLTTPLKRTGPKGSGQFEPISWSEALSSIAVNLHGLIGAYGPEAVLPFSYAGTMGILQKEGMATRFFNRMGASRLARGICSETGMQGYSYTIGDTIGMETESYAHARLILIWGSNTLTSNMHLWPFIQEARKQGAKVIVIDPARTRTARAGDEWIGIRPGTDSALALAMMHVIIGEERQDTEYVEKYTLGFDALAERVSEWTPERAASITGISARRIRQLARDYATTAPAAIRLNYGMQRHAGGGMAVRTIACLPALVGTWRQYGGGIQLSTSGGFRPFNYTPLYRPDLLQTKIPRTINMNRLGDALSLDPIDIARAHAHPRPVDAIPAPEEAGPPVKALLVYNCNPAAVCPDQSAVLKGLCREDLFTVVLEHFQTDTADYADYILPATTQLEHLDLHTAYGHLFLSLNRPAIAPVGQSQPNSEIFRRLATAMGYTESCFKQSDEEILQELVECQEDSVFDTTNWGLLCEKGFARLNLPTPYLPFAQGNFPTPSGKCEFFSQRMAEDGYDPLPTYTPPRTLQQEASTENTKGDQIPTSLLCISPPAHSFLNSSFANLERFKQREQVPLLWIHPDDAESRQIIEGAKLSVWNEKGSVLLQAHITEDIIPGTVLAPGLWWNKFSPDQRNINQITPQDETDMGAGATFYDTRVYVEVAEARFEQEQLLHIPEVVAAD